MRKLFVGLMLILFVQLLSTTIFAADVILQWDPVADATGYKLYQSVDLGVIWDVGVDVANVTTFVAQGVPDTGIVMFRVSAYNANGEAVRYSAGVFYCGDCNPPVSPSGLGMQ